MNPNDDCDPPVRTALPGRPQPPDEDGPPTASPPAPAAWFYLFRLSPAVLFTLAYAVNEHRYFSRGGSDSLHSLSGALALLPLGLVVALVVAIACAGWSVRDRPRHRSAAVAWLGSFLGTLVVNVTLMFGGCQCVARLQSS